jgi:hypothetical protein
VNGSYFLILVSRRENTACRIEHDVLSAPRKKLTQTKEAKTKQQAPAFGTDEWNGCRLEDANLAHWHGSRNAMHKLKLMQSINQDLNIPEIPMVNRPTRTMDISHYP